MPSCEIFRTFAHGIMAVYQKQSFHKMNSNMKRFCSIYVVLEMIQVYDDIFEKAAPQHRWLF